MVAGKASKMGRFPAISELFMEKLDEDIYAWKLNDKSPKATSVQLSAILQALLKNHDFLSWREIAMDQSALMEERSD